MKAFRQLRSCVALLATLAALATFAHDSHAYRLTYCRLVNGATQCYSVTCSNGGGFLHRTSATVRWYLNPGLQGYGKYYPTLYALAAWNNVTPATYYGSYAGTTTRGYGYDGYNVISWGTISNCNGCLAVNGNWWYASNQAIAESDTRFNNGYPWKTNGTAYDVQAVLTHELGHSWGIAHSEVSASELYRPTMNPYYFTAGYMRTLEPDDKSALNCIYSRYRPAGALLADETSADPVEPGAAPPEGMAPEAGGLSPDAAGGPAPAPLRLELSTRMTPSGALLAFTLPQDEEVSLDVFDVAGRKVANVLESRLAAGQHEVIWSAEPSVAHGVYFARLRTSTGQTTAKVLIAK